MLAWARIYATKGNSLAAEASFVRYLAAAPGDPKGYAYFARMLIDDGDYARADALSAHGLEQGPSDPTALGVRGQILAMKGNLREGEELMMKAIVLDQKDAETYFQLGSLYDRQSRTTQAVEEFRRAVAVDASDARAWDYLALDLEPEGKINAANEAYLMALRVNRKGWHYDGFVDYNYGRFLMKRGYLTASKVHLDRAVDSLPGLRAPLYERARLELRRGHYGDARRDAEAAAGILDEDGAVLDLQVNSLLESIYQHLGAIELAKKHSDLLRQASLPVLGDAR